ncbi:MAG: DUF1501 domain-containing protein [Planctomycetaceae bacterium]|nr:DUF1501 domain-containing protein [Planctomycetaceae bacterium]
MSSFRNPQSAIRNRFSRRELLRLAAAGVGAASASGWLPVLAAHAAHGAESGRRHKSCIVLYMSGGPSHIDTFDLKHDSETGTEFQPISTSVPGIQISEHLPKLARLMHHGAIIRSMNTVESDHDRGRYLMHTGYRRSNGGVPYPSLGALVSAELGQPGFLLPNFVVCNLHDRLDPAFTGYLPPQHRGLILPTLDSGIQDIQPAVEPQELADRLELVTKLDDAFRGKYRARQAVAHQANYCRSFDLMRAEQLKAFDLSLEPASSLARYTPGTYDARDSRSNGIRDFGRGCLLARRLVEVGVPFVEVVLQSWDTHQDNFPRTRLNCEALDPAMSALVEDLKDRDLLDSTLIVWMGEFGRTPKFENTATGRGGVGRGHFGRAWSTVLMGGGIQGGQVIGRTDNIGGTVEDRPVSAPDFMATICQILGIDWQKLNDGPGGRTVRITDKGAQPIKELVGA